MFVGQPVVIVPARSAAVLAPLLREVARRTAARDGLVLDAETRQILDELEQLARAVRNLRNQDQQVREAAGTSGTGSGSDRAIVADELDCSEVASRLGVSARYVRRLAGAGTFPGSRRTPQGWRFDRFGVDEVERNRHERTR